TVDGIGSRRGAEVKTRDLHGRPLDVGEAVEDPVGVLHDVDREPRERLALGRRLEPEEDVAFDRELGRELGCELWHPRAGGDDELLRVETAVRRYPADALGRRCPALDRLREPERCAVLLREPEMGLDRT